MKIPFTRIVGAGALTLLVAVASGCSSDHRYDVENLKDIDATVTLFNNGISLPLGQTEQIAVGTLLDSTSVAGLDSMLVADPRTGNYAITSKGDYNLDEIISEMHLDQLKNIDGSSFSKDIEYVIGDIDPSQFVIEGKNFDYKSEEFPKFNLDDIPVPSLDVPDQKINTNLYKYLPSDLDIGKKIGNIEHTQDILDISTISSKIPSVLPGDVEVSVQSYLAELQKDKVALDFQKTIDQSIALGENASQISDINGFQLKSGSLLKVEIEVVNCPLTAGQIVPDLDLDMSSMLNLAEAISHKVDLSSMVLKKDNSWKTSKSFSISSLAENFPKYEKADGEIKVKGLVDIAGDILIQSAKSTPNTIKGMSTETMKLKANVSLDGVVLETMEITLGEVSYNAPDVNVPINIQYALPEGIKDIKKVYLDQTKKFDVNISANGLSTLKSADGANHISVIPEIVINIPEGLEVAEADGNNQIKIEKKDLYDGPITTSFTLVSITPKIKDSSLSFNGNITATIKATAKGTVSSKYLPTRAEDDVVITTKMGCKPKLTDYDVTLDPAKIAQSVSESREFSFELEGLGDFGTFNVNLQGSPTATLKFDMPSSTEVQFVAKNLVIAIPTMMVIDGTALPGSFDEVKNSLTLNGVIPAEIVMPIKHLRVVPEPGQSGKTVVKGTYKINGTVSIDKYDITRKTFDELSGKSVNVQANIPSLKATSISLEGDFSKSLDYDIKDVVILDSKTISDLPKEIKTIDNISLEGVNAIIELKVQNLPDLQGDFYLTNTTITLPSFIIGESGNNVLVLDDQIPVVNGQTIRQIVGLTNIKNVQLSGITELKGDILLRSKLISHCPVVDLSTLKGKINAHCCVGVGNGSKATVPGKIAIDKAEVKVEYNYNQSESISFGEIPAELQEETVNLALNPNMYISLTTNFCAPVKGEFEITPYIGGKPLTDAVVKIPGIELPYSTDPSKTLTNKYAIGQNPPAEGGETVIHADLGKLVKRIPDSIKLAIKVLVDQTKDCIIYPDAQYNCSMNYKFDIPVKFSNGFSLSLNPSVDLEESSEEFFRLASVCLKGNFYSTLPIGANCNIKLLDAAGLEIPLKEPCKLKLLPGADGTEFKTVLDIKDRENASPRKILFEVSVKTSDDVNLNKNQYVQVKNLSVTLPDGITYNLNDEEE